MATAPPGVGGIMSTDRPSSSGSFPMAALQTPSHCPATALQVPASPSVCVGGCPAVALQCLDSCLEPLSALRSPWHVIAWNMRGYTTEKLEHLLLLAIGPAHLPVLAYLLQETHLLADSPLLGTPVGYSEQLVPSPSSASHEGQALLLHPAATVLWQHIG